MVRSARLEIVTARMSDLTRSAHLAHDDEARHWLGLREEDLRLPDMCVDVDPLAGAATTPAGCSAWWLRPTATSPIRSRRCGQ
jgi:hypothetical protein